MGLFDTFNKVTYQDWLDKITADLKGKDFNETLVWNTDEGIDVQPFYNSCPDDFTATPIKETPNWEIRETVIIQSFEDANKKALLALKGGANSILFIGNINTPSEMELLLKDIQTDIIEVHFYNSNPKLTSELIKLDQGSISYDILENNTTSNINDIVDLTNSTSNVKTITVKHTVNTSIINELAYSLSKGVEYLNVLTDKGIEAKKIDSKMQFTFGISTNYFFEIAKLRAARILWNTILTQYSVKDTSMTIHAETTVSKKSEEDKNYDILRNTTKAMSAIIGGCDSLTILPHDNSETNIDFSNRIARNIQHLLKEEAFFGKVNNPADGSYYIEQLTHEIANKSWTLFQEIEKKGGFLACIENGFIENKIEMQTS